MLFSLFNFSLEPIDYKILLKILIFTANNQEICNSTTLHNTNIVCHCLSSFSFQLKSKSKHFYVKHFCSSTQAELSIISIMTDHQATKPPTNPHEKYILNLEQTLTRPTYQTLKTFLYF